MTKLIILLLTLLPVLSYSQVTSINVDTSIHQVIIINNGTMIENNGGTVNINGEINGSIKSNESRSIRLDNRYVHNIPKFKCDSLPTVDSHLGTIHDDNSIGTFMAIVCIFGLITLAFLGWIILDKSK